MTPGLVERDSAIRAVAEALALVAPRRGAVLLVSGEAGIGKTAIVRALVERVPPGMRTIVTGCDDLRTSRPLGPLRDAVSGGDGPLAAALTRGGTESVFEAARRELAGEPPTVLVVEDVHWADDATLDVLAYVGRRIDRLSALVVLTFRDDLEPDHPLHRLLGALVGHPVRRVTLPRLSPAAVAALAAPTGRDPVALHELTGGNPFFVTEVLAAPAGDVPATVLDAVAARAHGLSPAARAAIDVLSVVPSHVPAELVPRLFADAWPALAEAEAAGMLEVRPEGIAFRHELARRAIEHGLPAIRRRLLNQSVVDALRSGPDPDLARLVHHAVEAGDVDALIVAGPRAAREAAAAGAHREALAHLERVLPHLDRFSPVERAGLVDDYGWELYNALRFPGAVTAGREAVARFGELDDPVAFGLSLVRLSRYLFMTGDAAGAEDHVQRALEVLGPAGDDGALAQATVDAGAVLALTDRPADAVELLGSARRLAAASGRDDLDALARNYLGVALVELGDADGVTHLRASIRQARAQGHDEYVARGYTNLAEVLLRLARHDELAECVTEGLRFTAERGFRSHAYNLEVHRCVLLMRRGDWDGAEAGLRALMAAMPDPGMLSAYSAPWLARLEARRGVDGAGERLQAAWTLARGQGLALGVVYTGLAMAEWAWLADRPDVAVEVGEVVSAVTRHPGAAPFRGELRRTLARCGVPVEPFPGCPARYAAGIAGDWRAAAAAWRELGDPYEVALELARSGLADETREALSVLDDLGAAAVTPSVRAQLRELGVRPPRGPQPATRENPAQLTDRQVEVLRLVADGLTNAEIADRLVVSVRTVDHHVAAILAKLGVRSRRQAAVAARELGIGAAS